MLMGIFGDLERLLAELWPFRIPIAIGFVVLAAVFLYVAWRREWYRIVLAHPRASVFVVVAFLIFQRQIIGGLTSGMTR